MCWESISQLARKCRQVHVLLLHVLDHHLPCAVIRAILAAHQALAEPVRCQNAPHEKIGYDIGNRLHERREFASIASDDTCVPLGLEGKNIDGINTL